MRKNTRKNITRALIILLVSDHQHLPPLDSGPEPRARSSLPGEESQRLKTRKRRSVKTSTRPVRRRDWDLVGRGSRRDSTGSVPEVDSDWAALDPVTTSNMSGRDSLEAETSWAALWARWEDPEEAISLLTLRWKTFRVKEAFVSAWARGNDRD